MKYVMVCTAHIFHYSFFLLKRGKEVVVEEGSIGMKMTPKMYSYSVT